MVTIDWIFEHVWLGLLGIVGWLMRIMWNKQEKTLEELHQLKIDLPTHYVTTVRLESLINDIKNGIHRIEDKLDQKEDKT